MCLPVKNILIVEERKVLESRIGTACKNILAAGDIFQS